MMKEVIFFVFLAVVHFSSTACAVRGPVFACDTETNSTLAMLAFCNTTLPINQRVYDLIGRLTLEEKVKFLAAGTVPTVKRLGIPRYMWFSEALHGIMNFFPGTNLSKEIPATTVFPQVILTAASFNTSLFKAIGQAISTEARAMYNFGLTTLTFWAPNVNIFRDPRWGRGQETPGEDPLLTSKYASAYVRGLQQREDGDKEKLKVAGACKHYTAYDLEKWGPVDRFHFDAVVTKQDLEDTFQPPFESCILHGKVAGIMCAYNEVNGKPACGDHDMLYGVIRGKWKLDGYIVSDCDSVETMFESQHYAKTKEEAVAISILAGLDVDCGFFSGRNGEAAVKKGLVKESDIDKRLFNGFRTLMRLGFFDGNPKNHLYGNLGPKDVCSQEHQQLALDAARQGIVLLKNSPASLPLSPTSVKNLAVIGPNANVTIEMLGSYSGSPCKNFTFLQGLTEIVPTTYVSSCSNATCLTAKLGEAKRIASMADATMLIMGENKLIEQEGLDRYKLDLPGKQNRVIREVAKVSKGPVILVIMSGTGMDVSFAKSNENITSILWVGYPGEAGGAALADIIFGRHNPSGRLPMTWYPKSYTKNVLMTNMNMRPNASTRYPGRTYRFYTGETVYSFGDGLSYSDVIYKLVQAPDSVYVHEENHLCGQDLAFEMHLEIRNLGRMRVSHSVLMFSTPPAVHNAPQKQLVDFKKVMLDKREATTLTFKVGFCQCFTIVDEQGSRKIALGEHIVQVGNIRHSINVRI